MRTIFLSLFASLLSAQQTVTYSPTSLSFNYVAGEGIPAPREISLGLQPAAPPQDVFAGEFTEVIGHTWLRVVLMSGTPGKIVSVLLNGDQMIGQFETLLGKHGGID